MKIELDKCIGDIVWLMYKNKAVQGTIKGIDYNQHISDWDYVSVITFESYTVEVNNSKIIHCDKTILYPDRESLIKSL